MEKELQEAIEKLNPEARRVLETATEIALQHYGSLGVEHLVKALITEATQLRNRLQAADLTPQVQVLQSIAEDLLQAKFRRRDNQVYCTPRVFRLLTQRAVSVAERRGRPIVITPEDLLIAVLQEEDIPLVRRLTAQGINISQFIARLERSPLEIPVDLRNWCFDLTAKAERKELLPLVGRERELQQLVRILLAPIGPANPIVIGEAGVGKTALIHGLAQRIAAGQEPLLQNVRIIQVDLNAMQAGTMLRGSFEDRLQHTIEFARRDHRGWRIILFIDEIHLIIGAGRAMGAPADAAQILLQHLQFGEIRLIGVTTQDNYAEYIEPDEALARRFTPVRLKEPTLEETRHILLGVRSVVENRGNVRIPDGAIEKCLDLCSRYLFSQRLPDKAIKWLTAAATFCASEGRSEVHPDDVVLAVSEATGIPPDIIFRHARWAKDEVVRVLTERVRGQQEAIEKLASYVLLNLGPLREDRRRPVGVFLLVGPSGVGKTELAKALAELLFADESRMVRLDMSEYQGELAVQRLIGPPRGIVNAGRGELTEKIRRQPYTILLLDEFEKADPRVQALFLQVFDEGWLTDSVGRRVYFTDTIVLLTSNIGSEEYQGIVRDAKQKIGFISEREALRSEYVRRKFLEAVEKRIPPVLRGRLTAVCVFNPLGRETLKEIAQKLFDELKERMHQELGKHLTYTAEAVETLVNRSFESYGVALYGARAIRQAFEAFVAHELNPRLDEAVFFHIQAEPSGILKVITGQEMAAGR